MAAAAGATIPATPGQGMFEFSGDLFPARLGVNTPRANIRHTDRGYRLELAAPGLELKDFCVEIIKGLVCISAEKGAAEEQEGRYLRREYSFYSFCRTFALPDSASVDKIEAWYEKGILTVCVCTGKDVSVEPVAAC